MTVKCPTCDTDVEWTSSAIYRPFCSKRCQLIDLGQWANEENAISDAASNDSSRSPADAMIDIEEIEALLSQKSSSFFND